MNFVSDHAINHTTARRPRSWLFVSLCVPRQGVDQTDVRTFRRFDRTYALIVCVKCNVSNFSLRVRGSDRLAECGDTTFVRNLRQRAVLSINWRQLAGTKELFTARKSAWR